MRSAGRITRTQGYEGAVVVKSRDGIRGEPKQGEPVFIVIDGIPVPFFTREACSPSPDTLIISFDDYLTAESVMHLRGCELLVQSSAAGDPDIPDIAGYSLKDKRSSLRGTISRIIPNPGHPIIIATFSDQEVFIPMHPDLIISVDHERKTTVMSLPEGLIDLNK